MLYFDKAILEEVPEPGEPFCLDIAMGVIFH